jgi:ComF family protein
MQNMQKHIKQIKNLFFPNSCALCSGIVAQDNINLCVQCKNELPQIKSIEKNNENTSKILALYLYHSPVDYLITKLKFNHKLSYANLLGNLLAEHLFLEYQNKEKPEIIIPVPLHKNRLKERGFNQALEIAKPVSKKLQIKIDRFCCSRTKNTAMQSALSAKKRAQNVKQAFTVTKNNNYKYVAIIDDVYTTGNTVNELCKTLEQSGIVQIDVWCVAKSSNV